MELSRMILRFSSWVTRWIVQQFTDWVLRRKKRLEVVGIDDEFLIIIKWIKVSFGQLKGNFQVDS